MMGRSWWCSFNAYPVPRSGLPLRSQRKLTGKSPSSIWQEIAALMPSRNILVIACIGIIFGGTVIRICNFNISQTYIKLNVIQWCIHSDIQWTLNAEIHQFSSNSWYRVFDISNDISVNYNIVTIIKCVTFVPSSRLMCISCHIAANAVIITTSMVNHHHWIHNRG